jgi:hypothetical protein
LELRVIGGGRSSGTGRAVAPHPVGPFSEKASTQSAGSTTIRQTTELSERFVAGRVVGKRRDFFVVVDAFDL